MIEIFLPLILLFLFIWFLVWAATRKKSQDKIREEQWDKEKEYIQKIEQIKYEAQEQLHEKEIEHRDSIKEVRKDSVKKSRSSLSGKIWEQVCSLIPHFKFNPSEMRFFGSPIDYLVFEGMDSKKIKKIIFLEIKTGDSKLTDLQEQIKKAVKEGRVEWKEYRLNPKGL